MSCHDFHCRELTGDKNNGANKLRWATLRRTRSRGLTRKNEFKNLLTLSHLMYKESPELFNVFRLLKQEKTVLMPMHTKTILTLFHDMFLLRFHLGIKYKFCEPFLVLRSAYSSAKFGKRYLLISINHKNCWETSITWELLGNIN